MLAQAFASQDGWHNWFQGLACGMQQWVSQPAKTHKCNVGKEKRVYSLVVNSDAKVTDG